MVPDLYRLLLIQDNASDAKLIQMMLSRPLPGAFEVHWEETLGGALAYLNGTPCDLVLLDLALGGSPGLAPLVSICESWPGLPVVVLTAYGDRGLAAAAVEAGARDYLIKGQVSAESLSRILPYNIEIARLRELYQACTCSVEREVTQRTAELRARYARTHAAFESMTEGVLLVDRAGQLLHLNRAAEERFARFSASSHRTVVHAAIRDLAVCAESHPEQVLSVDGTDLLLRAALLSGIDNGSSAVVVTLQEVGYLKDADRMKSRFISDVSRELRTPLTTLKVCLDLIRKRPEQVDHYLRLLDQEIDHQVELVEQILELSDLDAGRLAISPRLVDLNTLADEVVRDYEPKARQRNMRILYRASTTPALAYVDPARMGRALGNLLKNAFQYTPDGGLVMVSLDQEDSDGRQWATVCVADTGVGIAEHELPRIFERFYRGTQAQSLQIPGSGLGLAVVDEIMRLHGGWVRVDSRVGKGSTFTLWVPVTESRVDLLSIGLAGEAVSP